VCVVRWIFLHARAPGTKLLCGRSGRPIVCVDIFNLHRAESKGLVFSLKWKVRAANARSYWATASHRLIHSQTPWAAHTPIDVTLAAVNARLFMWSTWWRNSLLSITLNERALLPSSARPEPAHYSAHFLPYTIRDAGNFRLIAKRKKLFHKSTLWFTARTIAKFDLVLV
jgi:hypothetical protein